MGDTSSEVDEGIRRMIVYISGPMTGVPVGTCIRRFREAEKFLADRGDVGLNPTRWNGYPYSEMTWSACLRHDIRQLLLADRIYMCRGWQESRGATLERFVAASVGMEVEYERA